MPSGQPIVHPRLWERIVGQLRPEILSGELEPGTRLIAEDLALRYGVSRGPIREALRALESEGLAISVPRRGTIVGTMTISDLHEVYATREAIEQIAAREVIATAGARGRKKVADALAALEGAWEREDHEAATRLDLEFHRLIVELSANSRLMAIADQMTSQTRLLAGRAEAAYPDLRARPDSAMHRRIFDAIAAGDAEAARLAIEAHYSWSRDRLVPGFAKLAAGSATAAGTLDALSKGLPRNKRPHSWGSMRRGSSE